MRSWILVSLVLFACQREDRALKARLDQLLTRVDAVDARLAKLGGEPAAARPMGPDADALYAVPIDGDPVWGPPTAKVTLIKAAEFACPYCYQVGPTLDQLKREYGDDLRIVWKDFIVHPDQATVAALAGCAAQAQGKFWELEREIWARQWAGGKLGDLGKPALVALARGLGLDLERFDRDLESPACQAGIADDRQRLTALGVRGTPSFFINGRYLGGPPTLENFKKLIDEERAKATDAIGKGTRAEEIYPLIVARGRRTY